jgi:hypothetical protein
MIDTPQAEFLLLVANVAKFIFNGVFPVNGESDFV